jgi:hypothetical protein
MIIIDKLPLGSFSFLLKSLKIKGRKKVDNKENENIFKELKKFRNS